jgi:light-independent protochlorophyllide reductase N subunit
VVFLGSINDATAEDFRREAEALGIPVAGFLPANHLHDLPPIGKSTIIAPLQPYLAKVATRISRERGAKVLSSLFPLGPDGTRQFWEDLAKEFGMSIDLSEREHAAWERIKSHCEVLKGRRVFITADSLIELPLARFLKSAGAEIAEVSSVYINKKISCQRVGAPKGRAHRGATELSPSGQRHASQSARPCHHIAHDGKSAHWKRYHGQVEHGVCPYAFTRLEWHSIAGRIAHATHSAQSAFA